MSTTLAPQQQQHTLFHLPYRAPSPADKYRGAVVEDLQLPPAFCLPQKETISRAIDLAYDRDFSHIPVLADDRKPLGYIDVTALKQRFEAGEANPSDLVKKHTIKFNRSPSHPYTIITPLTPLDELETFLNHNLFALVTDPSRIFVLGLATLQDLESFVKRRGR